MRTSSIYIIFFLVSSILTTNVLSASELRERVYLHTDKQLYLAGELLWMKLYLTDHEGKPLSFSKVGYVELLEGTTARVQVKLDIQNATGEGWMEIPSSLSTGYYRLVGYTRNMKNEGDNVFFNKTIGVVNTFRTDDTIGLDTLVRNPVQSPVLDNTISVTTELQSYSPRSQSNIQIKNLPSDVHSLSVSIAGKDLITLEDESNNITRWCKTLGEITQSPFKGYFTPEYEGHIIHGNITDLQTGEIVSSETVFPLLGFVGDQIRLYGGQIQSKGQVEFYTNRIKGMHELVTTSFTPLKNKYRVNVESPFSIHSEKSLPAFKMNPTWEKQLTNRNMALQVLHAFNADSLSRIDTTYAHFQWLPDRSYILDEYTRFTRMDEVIIEFIPSLRFRKFNDKRILSVLEEDGTAFSIGNSLVLLDGIPITDHELIFNYDPLLIYRIDVYKSKYIFGGQYYNGIVLITTYNKDYPTLVLDDNTQIFDYEGTQAHRYFYSPSYANEKGKNRRIPDYRHTLLWQPQIQHNGETSLTLPFSTSDLTGEFQVTVEGITQEGRPIRGVAFFSVQ